MKKYNMILSLLMLCLLSCSDKVDDLEPENDNNENEVLFSLILKQYQFWQKQEVSLMTLQKNKTREIDLKTCFYLFM